MPVPAPPTPPMLKGKALGTWLNGVLGWLTHVGKRELELKT